MSAVFDLGLRCATSCAVARMLSGDDDVAAVDHLLARYRKARKINDAQCAAETSSAARSSLEAWPSSSRAEAEDSRVAQRSLEIAQRQMEIASDCEALVRTFRPRLLARHRQLYDVLRYEELSQRGRAAIQPQHALVLASDEFHSHHQHDMAADHQAQMEPQMTLHRRMPLADAEAQLASVEGRHFEAFPDLATTAARAFEGDAIDALTHAGALVDHVFAEPDASGPPQDDDYRADQCDVVDVLVTGRPHRDE